MAKPQKIYVACDTMGDVLLTGTNLYDLKDDASPYCKSGTTVVIWEYTKPKEVARLPGRPKKAA